MRARAGTSHPERSWHQRAWGGKELTVFNKYKGARRRIVPGKVGAEWLFSCRAQ